MCLFLELRPAAGLLGDGLDPGVGVEAVGPGAPLELDRLLRVEVDRGARVEVENVVLQRRQADDLGPLGDVAVAQLGPSLADGVGGEAHHLVDQVVGVDHLALAALHLALGQEHHAVRQVLQAALELGAHQG